MVNILYSFDTKFWKLAAVSILSALKSKRPESKYTFYCMVAPGTRGRRKIARLVQSFRCNIVWRPVQECENPNRTVDFVRWSPVIFYRLFAHKIFPGAERMIYLDSDTIVLDDLTELFETDMGENVMAGVPDYSTLDHIDKHIRQLLAEKIHSGTYINSGVLLINLAKMPDIMKVDFNLVYPDQDLINVALDGKIMKLSMRYNCIPGKIPDNMDGAPAIHHYYSIKPYYPANYKSYIFFEQLAEELGWTTRDFVKHEKKYSNNKTNYWFIRTSENRLRIFGITFVRL
ncbi:MAG: glycosyltransferase family 8 protein [Alphaproteobacteria bacterium]|nr:glycosyltransferase family 8 protein [Alphaproteobacteria bacterium]